MKIKLSKVGLKKSKKVQEKILETLEILNSVEVPLSDLTPRRLEKIAMSFLALGGMTKDSEWANCGNYLTAPNLTTREIIRYINKHFEENISESSYDDIRRKDLIRPVGMGLIIKSANKLGADINDGTRGYGISDKFSELIHDYKSKKWLNSLDRFELDLEYIRVFSSARELKKIPVVIDDDLTVELDDGPHNQIQRAVIEEFLSIYGFNASVLYVGDTSDKVMLKYSDQMKELGLNVEDRGMLPDIVAFSKEKGWLYLIEAVHSSNPLNPERCVELKRTVLADCKYPVVLVTAFLNRVEFKKWVADIAWETEVWLCDNPDHLIHFNGDKFLGPYSG